MNRLTICLSALMLASATINTMAQKERSEIEDKYKWNISDLYASDEAWSAAKAQLVDEFKKVETFKGRIGKSAKDMLEYLEYSNNLSKEISRLATYASLKSDQDLRDADNVARLKELELAYTDYDQLSSFVRPEFAQIPSETIKKYISQEPKLEQY